MQSLHPTHMMTFAFSVKTKMRPSDSKGAVSSLRVKEGREARGPLQKRACDCHSQWLRSSCGWKDSYSPWFWLNVPPGKLVSRSTRRNHIYSLVPTTIWTSLEPTVSSPTHKIEKFLDSQITSDNKMSSGP